MLYLAVSFTYIAQWNKYTFHSDVCVCVRVYVLYNITGKSLHSF